MRGLWHDGRAALRRLGRRPLPALATALTLALGIAGAAAVLALVEAAVVRPVAFPQAERLVDVQATRGRGRFALYPADYLAWREAAGGSFSGFTGYSPLGSFEWTGDGPPERLRAHFVSPGFFATLGIRPVAGREFRAGEDEPGRDRVVVLSHRLWQGRFGGDRGVIGRTLTLDGEPWTVVGVMPPGFGVRGGVPDLWAPLAFGPGRPADRTSAYLGAIGRLAPGATLAAARAELEAAAAAVAAEHPESNRDLRPSLEPLAELMVAGQRETARLLLATAALLLAAAAINAAAFGLAQAHARRGESALRTALGAGRRRLVRQWLLEGLPPAALGTALGVALAGAVLAALPDLGGRLLYRSVEPRLGGRVLALTAVAALAAWALAAGLPALAAARSARLTGAGGRATRGRGSRRTLALLVAGQIGVAAALLAGAGLLLRGLERLIATDLGFERRSALLLEIEPPAARYPAGAEVSRLLDELIPKLAALPGVTAAAAATDPPGGGWGTTIAVDGDPEAAERGLSVRYQAVTPGYPAAAGLRLLAGRDLTAADRRGAPRAVLLSRSAARALFPGGDAVGRAIAAEGEPWRVVGVVEEARRDPLAPARPAIYYPHPQLADLLVSAGQRRLAVVVRAEFGAGAGVEALAPAVRAALAEVDPALPAASLASLEARLSDALLRPRLTLQATALFAASALALSALGLYGALAFQVRLRRRELGVRMALGATRGRVVAGVVRGGLALAAAGTAAGLAFAALAGRAVGSLLHGVPPADPAILAAVAGFLLLIALAAAALPARRAAGTDPADSLRAE